MKISYWYHKYHRSLFPQLFISCLCRRQCILLEFFYYRGFPPLVSKVTVQYNHFYWGVPPNNTNKCPRKTASGRWLHCHFFVQVFFYAPTAAFLTKISLQFLLCQVLDDSLGGTWTPYDIKNSLTPGIKFLNKVPKMPIGNMTPSVSPSILKKKRVYK